MIIFVVFAGGPASGKSSVLNLLKNLKHNPNIHITFLNEIATYFLDDWPEYIASTDNHIVRQYYILKAQIALEDLAVQEAISSDKEITVIILDRGLADMYGYLTEAEVAEIVTPEESEMYADRYNLVLFFSLTDEKCFMSDNNNARHEADFNEVSEISKRTLEAWQKHSNCEMVFIPPTETIEQKADIAAKAVNQALGMEIFVTE